MLYRLSYSHRVAVIYSKTAAASSLTDYFAGASAGAGASPASPEK